MRIGGFSEPKCQDIPELHLSGFVAIYPQIREKGWFFIRDGRIVSDTEHPESWEVIKPGRG
jgi:hypothetical protein